MKRTGKIKWFDPEKRYGFVDLDEPTEDALLHLSTLNNYKSGIPVHLIKGAPCVVEVEKGEKGLSVKTLLHLEVPPTPEPVPQPPVSGEFERATVKWYNDHKGYGFLTRGEGTPDVFIHATTLKASALEMLSPMQELLVLVEPGAKGPKAASIKVP